MEFAFLQHISLHTDKVRHYMNVPVESDNLKYAVYSEMEPHKSGDSIVLF
jgi:hypothetical protein